VKRDFDAVASMSNMLGFSGPMSVKGVGVGVGVGDGLVGETAGAGTFTPLLHTNFLPDLMQV